MDPTAHPGSEHLIIVRGRAAAQEVAEELREEGFAQVRVARAGDGEGGEDPGWAVHVRDDRLPAAAGGAAYEGLRERFTALAHEHGGWYDEPGDPRPAE